MKKIINNPENVVEELIEGMILAHPEYIKKSGKGNIIVRKDTLLKKVSLISGGGSGHEPSHGGYVGKGMLDAAVCGDVFTSPTPDMIYNAIKDVDMGEGVLLVIKNYTGDVMNFEMAKEMAEMEDIKVDYVIVNDDVAVENSLYTAGRRGIAGTIFVHKIAGAKAEQGACLEEVKLVAQKVVDNTRSMGMSLSSCIVPASGKANFELDENQVEIGMGIHGEPGTHREEIKSADEITEYLVSKILEDIIINEGEDVAVLINGLCSTPIMELYIVNRKVNKILKENNINVYKTFVGEFMTSLEMAGFSISIIKLDKELKELLDSPADTPAFKSI